MVEVFDDVIVLTNNIFSQKVSSTTLFMDCLIMSSLPRAYIRLNLNCWRGFLLRLPKGYAGFDKIREFRFNSTDLMLTLSVCNLEIRVHFL